MKKILYVEDNPVNRMLVQAILESRPQVQLLLADSGNAGLETVRQQLPDLILLDLNLPDMDGEEYLRQLRLLPLTAHIPVVIVSADAMSPRSARFQPLGVVDYLTKPFDVTQLEQVVDRSLSNTP